MWHKKNASEEEKKCGSWANNIIVENSASFSNAFQGFFYKQFRVEKDINFEEFFC